MAKHIKGTYNILADFLSRPKDYKKACNRSKDIKSFSKPSPTILPRVSSITNASTFTTTTTQLDSTSSQTRIPVLNLREEIKETIADLTLTQRANISYKVFFNIMLRNHGLFFSGMRFHPNYPFLNVLHFKKFLTFPKEALGFFWFLFESYTIGIFFMLTVFSHISSGASLGTSLNAPNTFLPC